MKITGNKFQGMTRAEYRSFLKQSYIVTIVIVAILALIPTLLLISSFTHPPLPTEAQPLDWKFWLLIIVAIPLIIFGIRRIRVENKYHEERDKAIEEWLNQKEMPDIKD
jgi:hypothetical protein